MAATHTQGRQIRSAGIASITGWAMDLYDLLIILYVAGTIGKLLFPAQAATAQLALVYASFAVTLVMRPLGSAVFGNFADRNGRKRTMMLAIGGVGISTALMGAVPTYATAGMAAPLMFLALRLVQGVFVGGVVAATHTLGTETVPSRHRGLMSGLVSCGGAGAGAIVASVVFLVVSQLFPGKAFATYGWRVMFFTGLLTAVLSFYVYRRTEESPLWKSQTQAAEQPKPTSPLRQVLSRRYAPTLVLNILVTTGAASLYYLTIGFFPTFLGANLKMDKGASAVVLIIVNVCVVIAGVVAGKASDRVGRRTVLLAAGVLSLVVVPAGYLTLARSGAGHSGMVTVLTSLMALVALAASAPALIFLNERFPTSVRATGTALSWNVGFAIGGMTPTVVTLLSPQLSDMPLRLAAATAIAAVLLVVGALLAAETRHLGLGAPGELRPEVDHRDAEPASRPLTAAPQA
jgi:MHS family proline/betaine transporter-like MFS transporter